MSDSDEVLDAIDELERKIETLTATYISCTTDMLEAVKINSEAVAILSEAMALASSPNEEDLKRSQTLREAFDRYVFVRNLALRKEK